MFSLKERLKEILIRDNVISQEDLNRALEMQHQEAHLRYLQQLMQFGQAYPARHQQAPPYERSEVG